MIRLPVFVRTASSGGGVGRSISFRLVAAAANLSPRLSRVSVAACSVPCRSPIMIEIRQWIGKNLAPCEIGLHIPCGKPSFID
jgi:hypothetical protein